MLTQQQRQEVEAHNFISIPIQNAAGPTSRSSTATASKLLKKRGRQQAEIGQEGQNALSKARKTSELESNKGNPKSPKSGTKIVLNLFGADSVEVSMGVQGNTSSPLRDSSSKDLSTSPQASPDTVLYNDREMPPPLP
jgi:hypothetical protein